MEENKVDEAKTSMKENKPLLIIIALAAICALAFFAVSAGKKKDGGKDSMAFVTSSVDLPDALKYKKHPVDPLCFISPSFLNGEDTLKLASCRHPGMKLAKNDHKAEAGFVSTGFTVENPPQDVDMSNTYVAYKHIGKFGDGDVILVKWNDGGEGDLSTALLVNRTDEETLTVAQRLMGGGRGCNNGINDIRIDGENLLYELNITPYNFIVFGNDNPQGLEPNTDLNNGVNDCYGVAEVRNNNLVRLRLRDDIVAFSEQIDARADKGSIQECFNKLVRDRANINRTVFEFANLNAFARDLNAACPKPAAETAPAAEPAPAPATEESAPAEEGTDEEGTEE